METREYRAQGTRGGGLEPRLDLVLALQQCTEQIVPLVPPLTIGGGAAADGNGTTTEPTVGESTDSRRD
jgi:hypothetical protein